MIIEQLKKLLAAIDAHFQEEPHIVISETEINQRAQKALKEMHRNDA